MVSAIKKVLSARAFALPLGCWIVFVPRVRLKDDFALVVDLWLMLLWERQPTGNQ
ncbi:hypothetical protein [Microcoleus sp. EPA2]|uniref:hypothetical protein n=1 Tax=Microcoleus sp. EPA2 TaxID=2841654 RepID=UPI00312BB96C